MRKRRMLIAATLFASVFLIAAGCAQEDQPGDTTAAECSADNLEAFDLPSAKDFKLAASVKRAPRVLAQGGRTVKLGVFADLTGANSQLEVHLRNAAIMAAEQANEEGDLPVRLEIEQFDNKDGNPDTAPALAQRAIGDEAIVGIIGPGFSGETESAGPLFERAGLTFVTGSATRTDLTGKGWTHFFRSLGNDNAQGEVGELIVDTMGCTRVSVIDDKSAYGAGLGEVVETNVEAAGGEIVGREGIEPTTDYTSLVDSLLADDPEVVYYAGYAAQTSLVVKQYREKGGEAIFMSGDGSKDATFLKEGGEEAEGAILTCPCSDPTQSDDPELKSFAEEYEARFDEPAGIYAAEGWDVAQMFIAAIKAGGADVSRESVQEYILGVKDFKGITKTINWTDKHEVAEENLEIFGYVVRDGKYRLLGTLEEMAG